MSEQRFIELEVRFAHQDDFITKLNQVVLKLETRVERLEAEVLEQRKIIEALGGGSEAMSLANSKPPHY